MPYRNTWTWVAKSDEWFLKEYMTVPSPKEVIDHFITEGNLNQALGVLVKDLIDNGIKATITGYKVDASITPLRSIGRDIMTDVYQTTITLTVFIETDKKVAGSPILPVMVIALGKAIAIIILAVSVGISIWYGIRNLTTTSSTITTEYYDESGKLIQKTTENITKPPTEAWSTIQNFLIILVVAIAFLMLFPQIMSSIQKR